MAWLQKFPLLLVVLLVLTLGLAPWSSGYVLHFLGQIPSVPEPHILEKLHMLASGTLHRPIDIFDLCMHATPWGLLVLKLISMVFARPAQ